MFRVRRINPLPNEGDLIVDIPRSRTVAELREFIENEWKVPCQEQKLYYQGKELVDGHKLIEYNIKRNNIIQLMIKPKIVAESSSNVNSSDDHNDVGIDNTDYEKQNFEVAESKYYKIGDYVDYRMGLDEDSAGAWFEAEISKILKDPNLSPGDDEENIIFLCSVVRYYYRKPFKGSLKDIRPRSFYTFKIKELSEGMTVLANVNLEEPKKRGLWYDIEIREISGNNIKAVALVNADAIPVDCSIQFNNEILRIEKPELLSKREGKLPNPILRKYPIDCTSCNDNKKRNCKDCGCHICGKKDHCELLLLCDECDMGYHINCLNPPLEKLPDEDEWFCPSCKNDKDEIVKAGEQLKNSSKRAKMPAVKQSAGRDWDNGMACAGRTKECTIVPKNHFGPVPGVEVGTIWKFRTQVSEAGIHRPLVAGIHGRGTEGAYSIVVSGGYEDDVDNGEEFEYTGAGGRDLSGNKRVNDQACDQTLEHTNKALALNCKAKFNNKTGAESDDWRGGKPVRVVRKYGKSEYAPQDGYRYDGIYKIVKYYPEKGKSGFIVWKYLLRRDDLTPAPWTKDAPVFDVIYPPEYLEQQEEKKKKQADKLVLKKNGKSPKAAKSKLKTSAITVENGVKRRQPSLFEMQGIAKKPKIVNKFSLNTECSKWIEEDLKNEQHWKECLIKVDEGKKEFLDKITEVFICICCQELVNAPVTLPCSHNVCKNCLQRSFKADIFTCPNCRNELGKNYKIEVNSTLYDVLKSLFPGYEKGR